MSRIGLILWCGFFFIPLLVMLVLDGFCSGKELCHAGLTFTLVLYGIGLGLFFAGLLVARLAFRFLNPTSHIRIRTLKLLFVIPLIPGIIVLGLFAAGLLGKLG